MYLLAGFMGLMALGSIAIVSMGDDADDTPPDDAEDFDAVSGFPDEDPDPQGVWQAREDGVLACGQSLFDRMGLINMLEPAPSEAAEALPPQADDAQTTVEVLKLHGFLVSGPDDSPTPVLPGDGDADADPDSDPDSGPEPVEQLTYDAAQDQLLIVFDDSTPGPEPELELRVSDDNPETTEIRLGDTVLASLPTDEAPPLSAIVLVGESDAAALGLAG
ncbi:hypothetical protein [Antarctobacter sp.]|uniref:hypothetical protein n=1 Tax=Antarctobacter sp. TaxID=1872577 RepID=UPI002B267718|nr:hypothetical protein [Antarctobacter sp.]